MHHYSHMVISFGASEGQLSETFHSFDEAAAFASQLAEEGECYDIYLCQILQRVPCQPPAVEEPGLVQGFDYPFGLMGRHTPPRPPQAA